jgi:MoxR-like ATPase
VIATQNPVEQAGVYPLPEAQLDRFLMRTGLGYPDHDTNVALLRGVAARDRSTVVRPLIAADVVAQMVDLAGAVHVDDALLSYVTRLAEYSRAASVTKLGVSTRGCVALVRVAKTRALSQGRTFVVPDDVEILAPSVIAHRLALTPDAEFAGADTGSFVRQMLDEVEAPSRRAA